MIIKWKRYCSLALVVVVLSCVEGNEKNGLVSKTDMADIIIKTYLAEAKIGNARIATDSAIILLDAFKRQLLAQKGIADSTLKASYTYYLARPKEMEAIMDVVVDTLSLQEQRITTLQHPDSLEVVH